MYGSKVYVQVDMTVMEDGRMLPRAIHWEDDRVYEIEKVTDIRSAAAMKAGGYGDRYTVVICDQSSYLFFERNAATSGSIGRWFVERRHV